jgi:hypothetical protein
MGFALPTPLLRCFGPPAYEPLNKAYSDADLLAQNHPYDFGHPWADQVRRELVISVTGPTGDFLARAWIASGATYTAPNVAKSTALPQPAVAVRIQTVPRSYAQLGKLMDDIVDATRAGLPDGGAIRSLGADGEHDRVVIEVQQLSGALAAALASRFGAEAIAIRIDPRSGPMSFGGAPAKDVVDPVLVAILLGASATGLALVLFVMRRRAPRPG